MTTVVLEEVRKSYGKGGAEVIKGIDLAIADGELLTLVGPSGCGKSTILNLIAGFERPSSGNVKIDGRVVNDLSPRDRGVAMVFQSYALYPHMSVAENIAFPLDIAGVPKAERDKRVAALAERLDIGHLLPRKPRELSGGQRQRVALGRALIRDPKLCLFDEPLSNLDAQLRNVMRAEIKKLHEQLGATFVYVTHDQTEAMTLSDRVVILNEGVIQQVAPPREVYDRPATLFVAGFMGNPPINVVEPAVLGLDDDGFVAAIRPENVTVGVGAPPPGALPGNIYVVAPTGAETWVTLDIQGKRITGRGPQELAAKSGAQAWMQFSPEQVLRFDKRSAKRIGETPS